MPATTTTTEAPLTIAGLGEVDPRIIAIGQRVVEVTGQDDIARLLAQLPSGAVATDPLDPLERAVAQVKRDFQTSNTISIDGWVLAASEANAAAVIALYCAGLELTEPRC